MSCQLNESQVQSWLDGDSDESQHVSECPECQQRLLAVQKLRSRLTPPPSPLGRDFARRTAQHVLRVTDVVKPQKPPTSWWGRLRDNPLLHVVQRERARRLLRLPGLAAVLLLYLLPGGYVFQYGDADAHWAYFGMVQLGLTVLIPLFLLSLEWTTLSALVRGRCLEEMLQAGLEPVLVSDTLALSGLRSLLPALLMTGLALLPVHPQSLLVWLPMTLLAFSAAGYLSQAHLLGLAWPRWLTFLGAGAVAGSLGAPAPWNLLSAAILGGLGYAARRQSVGSLELQQQGRLPAPRRRRGSAWQTWLARRLPDLALLQRELRRRNLFTPSILVGNVGICLAAYTMFDKSAYSWPLLAAGAGLLAAFSLVQREKDGGAYEVLLHSGLRARDFWAGAVWIAGLQVLPAILAGTSFGFLQRLPDSLLSAAAAALGTAISLVVSLRAGAVIGANIGVACQNSRQASTRCIQEVAVLCLLSLLIIGVTPPLVGPGSPLSMLLESIGLPLSDALNGISVLPVMVALHLRARSLSGPHYGFNPWTHSLALTVPACLWLQMVACESFRINTLANSCTGLALLIGLAWTWWAAPLAPNPGKKRWTLLACSYTLTLLAGLPLLLWDISIANRFHADSLPLALSVVDSVQIAFFAAAVAWLVYLLGQRYHWSATARGDARRRTLGMGLLSAALAIFFAGGMLRLAWTPRPHAPEFAAFLAQNRLPQPGPSAVKSLLKRSGMPQQYLSAGLDQFQLADRSYELRLLKPWQPQFQQLLAQILANPQFANVSDRSEALLVLRVQVDQALFLHQPEEALEGLEKMANLCAQAQRLPSTLVRSMCLAVRSRVLLASRSQTWTPAQLDRLDRLQAGLPDDDAQARVDRDRSAARHYDHLLHNPWNIFDRMDSNPVVRYFLKQQAETYLDDYLAGRAGRSGLSLAQTTLYQVSYFESRSDSARILARGCNRLVLDLERWKLEHGSYPANWTGHLKELRFAYQPLAGGYYLKVWMPQVDGGPLILTTGGPEFNVQYH